MARVTVFLVLLGMVQIFAFNSYSQETKLTLQFEKTKLEKVLDAIEQQSGFFFLYNKDLIDVRQKVNVTAKSKNITEILDEILEGKNIRYYIFNRQIVLTNRWTENELSEIIQDMPPSILAGTVTDESGLPLPGVTVIVKGTTLGTVTGVNGKYSITNIPGNATLVFSFVGMKTEIVFAGGQTIIDVVLEHETIGIEEVVAIGYGTMRKSDLTGSVVSVSEESLIDRLSVNIEQMLQGNVAGLSVNVFGNGAEGIRNTLLIRGEKSITASNNPLIILDGVPFKGQLSEINPNDIKSIEILKDASSSAIYGSRGANGIILITTKYGKAGEMVTSYSGSIGFEQIKRFPKLLDGKTFYELKRERGLPTTFIEDQGYKEGRNTDWLQLATRTGKKQEHNLSVSGGNNRIKYYLSASYTNVEGIAIGDDFKRYMIRINLDHKLNKWITQGTYTQYGYYDRSGVDANFTWAYEMNPLAVPFNEDGSIRLYTWEDAVYNRNPLSTTLYDNSDITRRLFSNNYLLMEFPFLKGLSFKLNTGYDFSSNLTQEYRGRDTHPGLVANGWLSISNIYDENWLVENILSYKADFDAHHLFLTALYSAQKESNDNENIQAEGFPNDVMTYYQPDKAKLIKPGSVYYENAHISQMFRAIYTYDSRYLLTITIRRDGFSAFGENKKFGIFHSVAAGWNIANEKFMQDINPIDLLKLRLSYGVNGNEAISPYSTLQSLSSINYVDVYDNTLFGFYPNRIADPSLGWETTKSMNLGLDFCFFNGRIRGLVDLFHSNTTDLLLRKSVSTINGVSSILKNIGETKSEGVEFQVITHNIPKKVFSWKTDFNISHYKNEIVHVGLTNKDGNYIDDVGSLWFIGKPIKVIYGYAFDGIWQEDLGNTPQGPVRAGDIRVKDINRDEMITPADRTILGQQIPVFVAGMTNSFNYRNWRFNVFLNGVYGIKKSNGLLSLQDNDLRINRYPVSYWTRENPNNDYPRNDGNDSVNPYRVRFIRDASFLRVQDISLRYVFSSKTLNNLNFGIGNLQVSGNIKNLFTFTKWEGTDPEFNVQKDIPQSVLYQLGLRFSF